VDKKNYIIVAGNGETSRANVEALLEDYLYAQGKTATIVLVYDKTPSQGQKFAAQLAKDKDKDIVILCQDHASFESIPPASVSYFEDPYTGACATFKNNSAVVFMLPNDEDPNTNRILEVFHKAKLSIYDLSQGLIQINFNPEATTPQPEPDMPEVEKAVKPSEDEEEETYEDEEDEDPAEEELEDEIYFGIRSLAKLIAKEVIAELVKADIQPSKGSRK
jgi:hypothetical protein